MKRIMEERKKLLKSSIEQKNKSRRQKNEALKIVKNEHVKEAGTARHG